MKRLTGLDASFLYFETSAQLMHVCGILTLDTGTIPGGYDFTSFRDSVAERASAHPTFREKLRNVPFKLDHPVWVEDPDFDIDRHIHRVAIPAPGGTTELSDLAGHLAGIPLDRSRPLWEMWVIEGLPDGKLAVFTKMHHASVDGVSGSNMISALCTLDPAEEPERPKQQRGDSRVFGELELAARGLLASATRPMSLVRLIPPSANVVARTISRAREGRAMAAPLTAPRTSFNATITGHRAVAFTDLSLEDIKGIKNAAGATVNDVVLTVAGGALRRYLEGRGENPESSLLAAVPVSVHETTQRSQGNNKVSALFTKLGTDISHPLERLELLAERNRNAKEHHNAIPAETLQDWAEFAAPRTFGMATRVYSGLRLAEKHPVVHNLVISNVPGPPMPLYFMGAKVDALYPLGPVFHGAGLNITVMSNNGRMHVGITACRELVPDVWDLANDFPEELAALHKAAVRPARKTAAKRTPAKRTPAKKSPAKKSPAKKSPAKKSPAKKSPAKRTPAKEEPTRPPPGR